MFRTAALMAVAGVVCVPAAYASEARGPAGRLEQVRVLAHEVQDEAEHVRAAVRSSRYRLTPQEHRALRSLDFLVARAREFHREAERPRVSPNRLDEDFDALQAAWRRTEQTFPSLRMYRHARQDFRRLSSAMDRLDRSYDRLMARDGRPGRREGWPHAGRR
jgi:hypothetical protein